MVDRADNADVSGSFDYRDLGRCDPEWSQSVGFRPSVAQERCNGVDWDKRTNGLWSAESPDELASGPEFESVHLRRDRPRWGGVMRFEDAAVYGRSAQ